MKARTSKRGSSRKAKKKSVSDQLAFTFSKKKARTGKGKKKATTKRRGAAKNARKTTSRKSAGAKKSKQPLQLLQHWYHRNERSQTQLKKKIVSMGGNV